MPSNFLNFEFLSNQVSDYLVALSILIGGFVSIKLTRCIVIERLKRWARKTATLLDDALLRLVEQSVIPLLYLGVFYISVSNLTLHPILRQFLNSLILIIATIFGIRLLVSASDYLIRLYWITRRNDTNVEQVANAIVPAIRTAAWALGIIFVLDNLGFNVSAVLAGVGIGGVAIALASQGVLQDLVSYFAILFDRPFELGDFIKVDDVSGTVKNFGIKTTRIQSLSGEEIVIANQDLTKARVHNFKRMERRRVLFQLGVIYETSQEKLNQIPGLIKQIITGIDKTVFDRAHLVSFGEFSLNYEVVYFVQSNDYNVYMDVHQQINLQIKQEFDRQGIEFAYPTQVQYLGKMNGAELEATTVVISNNSHPVSAATDG